MIFLKKDRVNLVITDQFIRYAYQKHRSGSLSKVGEVTLPEGVIVRGKIKDATAFAKTIKELIQEHHWRRKTLYFSVPDITVVIREIHTPTALTYEEALAYVKTQVGRTFHLPFTNPVFAINFYDDVKESQDLIVYAYPKDKMNAFIHVFKDAGLKPKVADLNSLSVYRYFYQKEDLTQQDVLLVYWNHEGLTLTAFHRHKAIFVRYVPMNEQTNDKLQSDQSMIEGMIRNFVVEIVRIIDFYQFSIRKGVSAIDLILLTGDFPYLTLVEQEINQATPVAIHHQSQIAEQQALKFADVIGLTMKKSE